VDLIVTELKRRMRERGDTAQIQRAEQTLVRLDEVDAKLVRRVTLMIRCDVCDLDIFFTKMLLLLYYPVFCSHFAGRNHEALEHSRPNEDGRSLERV
jgi:hypothetical protein